MQEVRLYYIDWLRVLVILSLIPYHAALTYTEIGSTYIKTTIYDSRVLPFLAILRVRNSSSIVHFLPRIQQCLPSMTTAAKLVC